MKIEELKQKLNNLARVKLGFFPTPLHKLENLSKELGVNLYLKRDDFSGMNLFGGNKIRKLEYLIGDAVSKGCEYVFTFGATQSNHAMQTATSCCRCGLKPVLYLESIVEPDENDVRSNLLLDKIMGAEIHIFEEGIDLMKEAEKQINQLESAGHKCYVVPMGGSNEIGSTGFVGGYAELTEQLSKKGIEADYIFHATGTGGTLAGLVAGKKLLNSCTEIISIDVSDKDEEFYENVAKLATETIKRVGFEQIITGKDINHDLNYFGKGYEIPTELASNAIKRLARTEGILADPVYSGKAFSALIDYIERGKVKQGSNVVFWHTGGSTALFAEKEIIGDLF